jgi:hypothetical protein
MLTSVTTADRRARRAWWFVYGAWTIMTAQALLFIIRYGHATPVIDELDFIPAVDGEEPFWPWIWQLHNEHRFVLPRLIWLPLTQFTGSYRSGCFVSLAGVSAIALVMVRVARRLRGRLHVADAFFPVSLLHLGHWENLRMGYQLCFMLNLVFAALLLQTILTTNRDNMPRRGWQAGVWTLLLLSCGAVGLAFGPFTALWLVLLFAWVRWARPPLADRARAWRLLIPVILVPAYIAVYLQGFARPAHHADPIVVWGSLSEAAWQGLRSALQALSMAFGPAAIGLWPASAFVVGLALFESVIHLARAIVGKKDERPRSSGLLLFLGAVVFMAYGIGWGRSVFLMADGSPGDMGMSSRYGWIVWPALGAIYFQTLIDGSERLARWGPMVLFAIVVAMLPFNTGTGIWVGEKEKAAQAANSLGETGPFPDSPRLVSKSP